MERVIRIFHSEEEADRADRAYLASLTPVQRVDILLEIVAQYTMSLPIDQQEFKRVCRVVEFPTD